MGFYGPDFPDPRWLIAAGVAVGAALVGLVWLLV